MQLEEYYHMKKSVFISFRTPDRDIVLPLYNKLKEDGLQVFMSSEDLEDGDIWASRLAKEMRASDLMLAFITPAYLSQQFQVDKEWYLANELQKPTIPVLYRVEKGEIPDDWAYITKMQYLPVKNLNEGEINGIVEKCKRSLEKGKVFLNSPKEVLEKADSLKKEGEWDKAVKLYERIADEISDAHPNIIYCRLMLRQPKEAREAARKALVQCPDNADTYFFSALSNLAGRQEYKSQILERSSELLVRAWEIKPSLEQCYLAICIAHLYNRRSFSVPGPINEMVQISKRYEFDENLLKVLRAILGI